MDFALFRQLVQGADEAFSGKREAALFQLRQHGEDVVGRGDGEELRRGFQELVLGGGLDLLQLVEGIFRVGGGGSRHADAGEGGAAQVGGGDKDVAGLQVGKAAGFLYADVRFTLNGVDVLCPHGAVDHFAVELGGDGVVQQGGPLGGED